MRRKNEESVANRKLITLRNYGLIDGFVKDRAHVEETNESAVIERILLDKILPTSGVSEHYIRSIYDHGLKRTYAFIMQNLAAGIQFAHYGNVEELIKLALYILNRPFTAGWNQENKNMLEGHFVKNCKAVSDKIKNEMKDLTLSFDERQLLEDDLLFLSLKINEANDFIPANYFNLIHRRWDVLQNNTFTFRLLYDVVELSRDDLWDKPEYRLKAIEVISDVCQEWSEY